MAEKRKCDKMENVEVVETLSKRKARKQVYRPEYKFRYPVIDKSSSGPHYVYCTVCKSDFSVAASGIYDVSVHVDGNRHKARVKSNAQLSSIKHFFKPEAEITDLEHQTMHAEMLFTEFIVEHNIQFAAADHFTKLLPKLCPDSAIAKKYACSRTKTTVLVNTLANDLTRDIMSSVKDKPYSLSSDGSNDQSDKFYPVVLRYVGSEGVIVTALLDVPTVEDASCTAGNIYRVLNEKLIEHGLTWEKCLALGADNANVMSGTKFGLIGRIRDENPNVYFSGCPCHLIALGAKYASVMLSSNVGSRLIDIYYYLKHSAKRQTELAELRKVHGIMDLTVLKYCPTRWLSLHQCVVRLLVLWPPLREFFEAESEARKSQDDDTEPDRLERCLKFLKSHTARCHCLFLEYALALFDKHNKALQFEKPEIHKSRRVLCGLYRELLLKFLKPSAFSSGSVLEINSTLSYHQKSDKDLAIGEKTRKFMDEKKFGESKVKSVCQDFRGFYKKAACYIRKKLPLDDPLLIHAEVFDISLLSQKSFSDVKYFTTKYPFLLQDCSLDDLEQEFLNLQIETLSHEIFQADSADKQWDLIMKIDSHTGQPKYGKLAYVAKSVLCIPHSNAACERVFSHVKHIRTNSRASMSKDTLANLCVLKNASKECFKQSFTREQTKKAKSATKSSLA